jgi:outer membrane receptor protein involved in Fe transport
VHRLPEIVVTANKIPVERGNTTQQIDVLRPADLSALVLGNRNLAEAVQYQPGPAVSVLSRNDANWGSFGGIGPRYGTFMLEGLPIDAFVDPQALPLGAVQRIEVQHGPASVLYPNYLSNDFAGSQTPLAGTVNLMLPDGATESRTTASVGYGSYQTASGGLSHQSVLGPATLIAGGNFEKSDYTNYGSPGSWLHILDSPDYRKGSAFLGSVVHLGPQGAQRLSLFGNQTFHSGHVGRPNRAFDHDYSLLNGSYSTPLTANVTGSLKAGLRYYHRTWQEDNYSNGGDLSLASDNGVNQTIVPLDLAATVRHNGAFLLTAGSDAQFADYRTWTTPTGGREQTGNDATARQVGLYAQEEMHHAGLVLRGGLRYTTSTSEVNLLDGATPGNPSQSWQRALWSLGAQYSLTETVVGFANGGSSFTLPGIKSIGGTIPLADRGIAGHNGQLPNPDLRPETGLGFDAGLRFTPGPMLRATVRAFGNRIDDAIIDNVVSRDPSQTQSVNAGATRAYGVETSLEQSVGTGLRWFANYTYTHSRIENPVDPDQDGAQVPFVPDHSANAGVELSLPGATRVAPYLHVAGRIYDSTSKSGRQSFSPHGVLNLDLSRELVRRGNSNLALDVLLYNVTNDRYDMPWQFRDPGFSGSVGVRGTF